MASDKYFTYKSHFSYAFTSVVRGTVDKCIYFVPLRFLQDLSSQDVSDIDERVLQHLAAAVSRAHYVRRRERQRSSGLGSSRVHVSSSPDNSPGMHQSHLTNTEGQEGLIVESSSSDLTSGTPICLNIRPQSPMSSPIANMAPGAAVNGGTFGSR